MSDEPLNYTYTNFKDKYHAFSNRQDDVKTYLKNLDGDIWRKLDDVINDVIHLLNDLKYTQGVGNRSLALNMGLATLMLDDLIRYSESRVSEMGVEVMTYNHPNHPNYTKDSATVARLVAGIVACINNMKMDCFFFEGKFLDRTIQEYNQIPDIIDKINADGVAVEKHRKEIETRLVNVQEIEKSMLKQGLTKSFKGTVKDLEKRILGFDIVNYVSLFAIFILTILLFSNFEWVNALKPENISIYERFVLIVPLIFLSWFASKRSQFLYQIKEEYSYKYNTALAYEGYKKEIDEISNNDEMKKRLMDVTIDNLARSPLEQFDKNSDHAPYIQLIREFRKQDK